MRRAFLDVGGRTVHYCRTGHGPTLVLLHGSPNSARALAPLMDFLSSDFECIGFDTPGNGLSDPLLNKAPSTGDYADALLKAVDGLGLTLFSIYGFHTGAGIAAEFAARHPERIASAVLDGLACWTREEQAVMLEGYLPPFRPQWDGAHLAWAWARMSEQSIFFPWHRQTQAARMDFDMRSPEQIHESVMELLHAGDNYRAPYAAALAGDGAARATRLRTPTLISARPRDPLASHLDRFDGLHPEVTVRKETHDDLTTIWSGFSQFLRRHPGHAAPRHAPENSRRFVGTSRGDTFVRYTDHGRERPMLLIHGAGASSREFEAEFDEIAASRPVIALDLPGHGESDLSACANVGAFADAVEAALHALGVSGPDAVGMHLGGAVAVELKRRAAVNNAALIGAPASNVAEQTGQRDYMAPDLSVRWDGAHLLSAWRHLRLAALFDPWFLNDRAHIYWGEPQLDVDLLERKCVDLLKCGPAYAMALQAQINYPLAACMRETDVGKIFAQGGDPLSSRRRIDALAALTPLDIIPLPTDRRGQILAAL